MPVLHALDRALKRNDIWDKEYETAFGKLMRAKDAASAEARVALMDYYVGESFGEELVCAVALDGARNISLLERYDIVNVTSLRRTLPCRAPAHYRCGATL